MTTATIDTTSRRELIDTYNAVNGNKGRFFDDDTLAWFKCRVSNNVYPLGSGYVFVTSERNQGSFWSYTDGRYYDYDSGRKYTVRHWHGGTDSSIDTVGDLMQYNTSRAAHKAAQAYVNAQQ